jgi:methyl-accepting chemotaxis protein
VLLCSLILGSVGLFFLASSEKGAEMRRLRSQEITYQLGAFLSPDSREAQIPALLKERTEDPSSPYALGLPELRADLDALAFLRSERERLAGELERFRGEFLNSLEDLSGALPPDADSSLHLDLLKGAAIANKDEEAFSLWLEDFQRERLNASAAPALRAAAGGAVSKGERLLASWSQLKEVDDELENALGDLRRRAEELLEAPLRGGGTLERLLLPLAAAALILVFFTWLLAHFLIRRNIKPLTEISTGLDDSAGMVVETAGRLSRSSAQLAKGAADNTQAVLAAVTSLETLLNSAKTNAANSDNCKDLMAMVKNYVAEANLYMLQISEAMTEIRDSGNASRDIIKSVEEIAFQTNILSLNAAVEAARAGEAGVGFAVVADEIRNLANKSRDAAQNTTSMLASSIALIGEGSRLVEKAKESFVALVEASDKVGESLDSIAAASQSQTGDIQEIHQSIALMDKVTQENALGAAETENFSSALNTQAGLLTRAVGKIGSLLQGRVGGSFKRRKAAPRMGKRRPEALTSKVEPGALDMEEMDRVRREEEARPERLFKSPNDKEALDQAIPMDDDF